MKTLQPGGVPEYAAAGEAQGRQPSEVDFPVSVLMKSAAQPAGQVPEPNHADRGRHMGNIS